MKGQGTVMQMLRFKGNQGNTCAKFLNWLEEEASFLWGLSRPLAGRAAVQGQTWRSSGKMAGDRKQRGTRVNEEGRGPWCLQKRGGWCPEAAGDWTMERPTEHASLGGRERRTALGRREGPLPAAALKAGAPMSTWCVRCAFREGNTMCRYVALGRGPSCGRTSDVHSGLQQMQGCWLTLICTLQLSSSKFQFFPKSSFMLTAGSHFGSP